MTIQRSKGYQTRPTLSVKAIGELIAFIKSDADHSLQRIVRLADRRQQLVARPEAGRKRNRQSVCAVRRLAD